MDPRFQPVRHAGIKLAGVEPSDEAKRDRTPLTLVRPPDSELIQNCPAEQFSKAESWFSWYDRTAEMDKQGVRQVFCLACHKWRWPSQVVLCSDAKTISGQEFRRQLHRET